MHPVLAELATGVDGSGRVAFCVVTLAAIAIDRPHRFGRSDPDQDHFASAGSDVGIQGIVDTPTVFRRPSSHAISVKALFSAGCGKILA